MEGVLHRTNSCPERKQPFNPHSLIPCASGTDFEVFGSSSIFRLLSITFISQINILIFFLIVLIKIVITNIGCSVLIVNNLQLSINGNVDLAAYNPAVVRSSFSGDTLTLLRPSFPCRMNNLNPKTIDDIKKCFTREKLITQLSVFDKEPT